MDDIEGLRERKKRETRLALSQAAIRLCVQRGWDNVSVADIAAAANVSERTFRNYFAGKAEAIAASQLERAFQTADDLRARPADEPLWDALITAVVMQYDAPVADDPSGWADGVRQVLSEPAVQGEVLKINAAALEELALAIGERAGLDAQVDLAPRLLAAVVAGATGAVVGHWLYNDLRGSVAPRLRSVLEGLRSGLSEVAES
jgi:AcrR family transcriptional regulator